MSRRLERCLILPVVIDGGIRRLNRTGVGESKAAAVQQRRLGRASRSVSWMLSADL